MSNNKENKKRLAIYLFIVYSFAVVVLLLSKLGYTFSSVFEIGSTLFSFSPAIACIAARSATNEGFGDMKLNFHFKGNIKYYLLAVCLPIIGGLVSGVLPFFICGEGGVFAGLTVKKFLSAIFMLLTSAVFAWITTVGEELGWRGYMNQKMEPLFGTAGTCVIGGIVWGTWHFPGNMSAVLYGGRSLTEALKMDADRIISLTLFGVLLMYLTRRTDSIIPAAIAHYLYNGSFSLAQNLGEFPEDYVMSDKVSDVSDALFLTVLAVYAVIFLALMLKDKKKKET